MSECSFTDHFKKCILLLPMGILKCNQFHVTRILDYFQCCSFINIKNHMNAFGSTFFFFFFCKTVRASNAQSSCSVGRLPGLRPSLLHSNYEACACYMDFLTQFLYLDNGYNIVLPYRIAMRSECYSKCEHNKACDNCQLLS